MHRSQSVNMLPLNNSFNSATSIHKPACDTKHTSYTQRVTKLFLLKHKFSLTLIIIFFDTLKPKFWLFILLFWILPWTYLGKVKKHQLSVLTMRDKTARFIATVIKVHDQMRKPHWPDIVQNSIGFIFLWNSYQSSLWRCPKRLWWCLLCIQGMLHILWVYLSSP